MSRRKCSDQKSCDSEIVRKLKAYKLSAKCVKAGNITAQNLNAENVTAQNLKADNFFINGKAFSTTGNEIPVTNATPMPLTEGRYIVIEDINKQIVIEGVNISLDLGNKTVRSPSGPALIIQNSTKIYVINGILESADTEALRVTGSYNVAIRSINTRESPSGMVWINTNTIFVYNYFVENITKLATFFLQCTNIYMGQVNITRSTFDLGLLLVNNCNIINFEKISFKELSSNLNGEKAIFLISNTFDIVIDNVSFYSSEYATSVNSKIANIYLTECFSASIKNVTITGESLTTTGAVTAVHNCIIMKKCANIELISGTFNDNTITGSVDSLELTNATIYLEDVTSAVIKWMTINSNLINVAGPATLVKVRGIQTVRGGDFVLVSNTSDLNNITNVPITADTSAIGFEVLDPEFTFEFVGNGSNNNGSADVRLAGGFRLTGEGTNDSILELKNCISNNNVAKSIVYSFYSQLSNTLFIGCSASSNEIPAPDANTFGAVGFLLSGTLTVVQRNAAVYSCTANENFVNDTATDIKVAAGIYAGTISGLSCTNLIVKNCDVSTNKNGIQLVEVTNSSILGNFLNKNKKYLDSAGIIMANGNGNSVISNSALDCSFGYLIDCPNSDFSKNLASNCTGGFTDITASGNMYMNNNSNSCTTSFAMTFIIPRYRLDKLTGVYLYIQGNPDLTAFTNIEA